MKRFVPILWFLAISAFPVHAGGTSPDARGIQFIPFTSFSSFKKSKGQEPNETILISREIHARIDWTELIASWNAEMPTNTYLKIEARAIYPDHASKWYVMGLWSDNPDAHPRESVKHQKDDDGNVDADTLILKEATKRLQLRLTLGANGGKKPKLKFLSVSMLNSKIEPQPLAPNRAAWGKMVDVPERSQMAYENGKVLCSPATVSMLLAHWSNELKQPALDHDVPDVVKGVSDPMWGGTGNWVFNTAYAGSFKGMRACTARLSDLSELEDWIAQGIPIGLSLCYNRLRGKSRIPSGHLVVLVGFTENGDPIINDPGTRQNVRKTFPRANLIDAWAHSKNAAYFIYPEKAKLPKDRFGHWDSSTARAYGR
jgi:hypothetical protein